MVTRYILNGATLEADGQLVLSDGRTFSLSDVPGNGFNANRLRKISAAAQEFLFDNRRPISSLSTDDPDRIHAEAGDEAWFLATYGGRMFIVGLDIVDRADKISFTFEQVEDETGALVGPLLRPHIEVVR